MFDAEQRFVERLDVCNSAKLLKIGQIGGGNFCASLCGACVSLEHSNEWMRRWVVEGALRNHKSYLFRSYTLWGVQTGAPNVEAAALLDSSESVHNRAEVERDGWTNGDRGKGNGNKDGSNRAEESRSGEEGIETKNQEAE